MLVAYKLVAYKKSKALIIINIPPLTLYNINLTMDLNWEWRQIRHATVKKHYFMIYGIQIFPLDNCPWTIAPHEILLGQLTPRLFPLDISPYKIPPKKITLRTFALWIITPE